LKGSAISCASNLVCLLWYVGVSLTYGAIGWACWQPGWTVGAF
jgi:hypothetical protein